MLSESAIQQRVRLEAARRGWLLWRNNVGACVDQNGRHIRYGLANESAAMNETIKSSDLIGIQPLFITPDMVGTIVGVFTAIECKHEGWVLTAGDKRGQAQTAFHDLVRSVGGIAYFNNTGIL